VIIYEVTLEVNLSVQTSFLVWLREHILEMEAFDGFGKGIIHEAEDSQEGTFSLVVTYPVRDRSALEHYFQDGAGRMRADGLTRFPDKFRASRRILKPLEEN